MVIRLPLAFVVGLLLYLIAMAMTVYDGAVSLILQPIVGTLVTGFALAALSVIGSPLLITPVWRKWQKVGWLAFLLTVAGMAAAAASWHPSLRIKVIDPETSLTIESFHPALAIGGWLLAMFGIAFCPAIGFRGDRRWV